MSGSSRRVRPARLYGQQVIDYEWRGNVDNAEFNRLHAEGFGHRLLDDDWSAQLNRHSLGWVCARQDGELVGFVNVAWDGGVHAFILDTVVTGRVRRRGVGAGLVTVATEHARAAGCEWLHVDFDDHLRPFYFDSCGFTPTNAGLIALTAGLSAPAGPFPLDPVGRVESPLSDRDHAPRQGDEIAPGAWLVFDPTYAEALADLRAGTEVLVLTWLDRARRNVQAVHPRDDPNRPQQGVFSTRSPDRPNPIGLHRVTILAVDGTRLRVSNLEARDGTPVIDVKPVLHPDLDR
jgi:tRNA-Thr(GGU) m(6)t(6)A37 methyltransferase TsaA